MDYNQPFSVLNERLRPRFNTSEQLFSSLNRLEDRQPRATSVYYTRSTILPAEPPQKGTDPKPEAGDEQDGGVSADPPQLFEGNSSLLSELSLNEGEDEDDRSSTKSEEKDCPGELASEMAEGESRDLPEGESIIQKAFMDGTLPDLIKSGRPLGRRRTLGHVSDTLKEVRREVELSRKRSIRLKAQVDKLQESKDGHGWSHDRERVTEEVLSIMRLLYPLTEPESGPPKPREGENRLDAALLQLQLVARKLALDHTNQDHRSWKGSLAEETAILQQALRDRDEAIEKKKAMEAELLRSKTEMMTLNNQLLEAVQRRLELSLELEAWKEDVQLMIQQQLQTQQLAEQSQKKNLRGLLRRNKPPVQRPPNFPMPSPAPPSTTNANQIYVNRPTAAPPAATKPSQVYVQRPSAAPTGGPSATSASSTLPRNWKDRLRKGRSGHQELEVGRVEDGFQVVSLD